MLQFPSDWVQHFGVNIVTAYPPSLGGRFRYYERLRPPRSFTAVVNHLLASDPEFKVHHVEDMIRIVTAEGEYGAFVKIAGVREGARAMRYIGAVFMDDFTAALDTIVIVPSSFAEFERRSQELLHSIKFGMTMRPRLFFYVPPAGWHGIPAGLVANYYPLDFPNNLSNIVIPPALPLETDAEGTLATIVRQSEAGLAVVNSVRDPSLLASGIRGSYLRVQGHRAGRAELVGRELAVFIVPPYAYQMRLETTNESALPELRGLFREVVNSFQPLPAPDERRLGRAFARHSTLFDNWTS